MATTRTDYTPHKRYVEAHFSWARADYKNKVVKLVPGLRIEHPQGFYHVETLAERIAACQECLFEIYGAVELATDIAALALEGFLPESGLVEQVLDLMQEYGLADDRTVKRKMVIVYRALSDGSTRDFWRGVGLLDPFFLAAALVAVERAGEPGAMARQLADLYFEYPRYLSAVPGGRVGRASVGELELVLYQVEWGMDGPPDPAPIAAEEPAVIAGSLTRQRGGKRPAKRVQR